MKDNLRDYSRINHVFVNPRFTRTHISLLLINLYTGIASEGKLV